MKIKEYQVSLIIILLSTTVIFLNNLRLKSYKVQQQMLNDISYNSYQKDSLFIESINTGYPSLTMTTIPIKSIVGKYIVESSNNIEYGKTMIRNGIEDNPFLMYGEALLADTYLGEFKLDSFQLYARKAFKNLSNNPVNFAMMSNVLKSENKIDSLLYHFERISSRVDDFQLHRIMLASLVDSEEYKDKGIQIVNNAIELYPDIEEFKVLSNYIEYSKNNIKLSEEVQRNAIELYKQGSFKMAITLFEESIRLFPKSKSYHFNLLTAYNDNNLYTRLIDHYEGILIDDFKIDKELQLLYINALFNSSKFDLACNMIKKIDPINSLEISKKIMSKCN
jgi:tetratricopeptide (TPR) repeat protein